MKEKLLIIDDEPDMLELLRRSLSSELEIEITCESRSRQAIELIKNNHFDLILTDIKMPEINGLELLKRIRQINPDITVIMMTAYGEIDMVIHAMKNGAYDFITKPFDHDALVVRLEKALERARLIKENSRLLNECSRDEFLDEISTTSPLMKKVYETIQMAAPTDVTILITGESGTGKNMAARAIHSLSKRKNENFVTVNCPTIPENILESELFGYKKGAFTHATSNKKGLFEEAENGTIFLDEIGEISHSIQKKLLRVIQDKEIKPLGDTKTIKINTRIITSTNQNLLNLVREGKFREDLYYRLNVINIEMPPLRERINDIPMIANSLLAKHCKKLEKPLKSISPKLMDIFLKLPWEGNIRELENTIIRGIIYSRSEAINPVDSGVVSQNEYNADLDTYEYTGMNYKDAKEKNLYEFNLKIIGENLLATKGNVSQAAKNLGLDRQGLQKIMKRYKIEADEYRN
ncbi:MAG: sigma-54-dependent Fis family transcriptional regulator [Desulfobacteraceae bacterium]|nr:sigma-54-dependent Fis family transcriptional regulator [Desulfobacteraceae bacterium]